MPRNRHCHHAMRCWKEMQLKLPLTHDKIVQVKFPRVIMRPTTITQSPIA